MESTKRKPYVPAITPQLRPIFAMVLALTALIGANSIYLVAVTIMEWATGATHQGYFYQYMFLGHLVLGLLLLAPFLYFAIVHMRNTWRRKNRAAVRLGYVLFAAWIAILGSGLLLMRLGPFELRDEAARAVFYWTHVASPLLALWAYFLHRLSGPPIKWRVGLLTWRCCLWSPSVQSPRTASIRALVSGRFARRGQVLRALARPDLKRQVNFGRFATK